MVSHLRVLTLFNTRHNAGVQHISTVMSASINVTWVRAIRIIKCSHDYTYMEEILNIIQSDSKQKIKLAMGRKKLVDVVVVFCPCGRGTTKVTDFYEERM